MVLLDSSCFSFFFFFNNDSRLANWQIDIYRRTLYSLLRNELKVRIIDFWLITFQFRCFYEIRWFNCLPTREDNVRAGLFICFNLTGVIISRVEMFEEDISMASVFYRKLAINVNTVEFIASGRYNTFNNNIKCGLNSSAGNLKKSIESWILEIG